jgi:hypothetical protein
MATDKTAAPKSYRRAQDFDQFGPNLETLIGRDVLLMRYSVSERPITDRETKERGDRTFVSIYVCEMENGAPVNEDNPTVYHAWSEPLANKLAQIPDAELPVLIEFQKVAGAQGNVWSFK